MSSPKNIYLKRETQNSKNVMQWQAFAIMTYSSGNLKNVDLHLVKYFAMKLKAK
jgi:hypothetical protein